MSYPKLTLQRVLPVMLLGSPLLACGSSQAPKELVDARAAYTAAESGYAKQLTPAQLHEAKQALDRAEQKFSDDGDSATTRDAAYIAMREAQLAEVTGKTQHFQNEVQSLKQQHSEMQAKNAQEAEAKLAQARDQLAREQAAREEAERRSKQALDKLSAANAAAVKQDQRGTVITLSGSVLFASGKSTLLPGSQSRLEQVAQALKGQEAHPKLSIEGYTDSTGSAEINTALSRARADAVADYLAQHGVPRAEMETVGMGSSQPIADNSTPEGRAQNRRVEIVVHNR
jgi:outer membrane protein OmpA-like peptidoglycan-associated protein